MIRFFAGFISGIYTAQQFKGDIPDLTKIINGLKKDILQKVKEYNNRKDN